MRITSYFRTWRNRTALGKQLSRVLNLLLFLLLIPLLLYFQTAQSRVNLAHEAASVKRVLALEAVRLEDYIAELGDYSLQLRNDSGFMGLLSREGELDYARQRTVESALRMLYYSRDDIEWMELYLLKSRAAFRIESDRRKVLPLAYRPPEALDDHDAFIAAPNYLSIRPEAAGFVRVTRTIIDSPHTTPLAVVRFLADSSIPDAMARSHGENGEKLYLFSPDGVSLTQNGDEAEVLSALEAGETALGSRKDRRMLAGFRAKTGLTLAVLKPIALINAALGHYSAVTTVLVALVLGLGLLLSEAAIRLFTRPVRDLARRMQDVDKGDLRAKDGMRGDGQLGLSAEANHMLAGISVLMDRSHVSELNERAARLAALEAQTNPHFLFNTLQAIATEAILAGDDKVYRMVTALAALMRYTIKGGNLVKLSTELEIVEKYLRLQKSRFGERLEYAFDVDDRLRDAEVPKLGLLALVENSVVHGMGGAVEAVRLGIGCRVEGDCAVIRVEDDGAGIPPERMAEIRAMLDRDDAVVTRNIGLGNLATRLRLLYGGAARVEIESDPDPGRKTEVRMIIPMEVLQNAQGADRG